MAYQVEHTDTFAGEANYCWVHRYTIDAPAWRHNRRELVRKAKALCGLTGVRCETDDSGDLITIRPRGMCQVVFVTWADTAS